MRVTLRASVAPSEDESKVRGAMTRLLSVEPAERFDGRALVLTAKGSESLTDMRDQLRDRHVRAAARRMLLTAMKGSSTSLMFNRQAAAAGVVALCSSPEQSPLGPIYATFESKGVGAFIDWLTDYEPR